MFVQSEVYAKPGELMQGALPGNKRFLLSNKSSRLFKNMTEVGIGGLTKQSTLNYKSQKTVELFWSSFSNKKQMIDISKLYFKQEGNIPIGKGLSSSSADVLGLLSALNIFYKANYSIQQLYDLAATIEPTDPCLHSCNLLFNPDKGEITHTLPSLPYQLIYFDSDKNTQVDTVTLSKSIIYSENQQKEYEKLCNMIIPATTNKDYESFNLCLNKSAEINQSFLPKNNFSILQDFATENKIGLFVAHSGTYMGFVVDPSRFKNIETKAVELIKKNWNTKLYTE